MKSIVGSGGMLIKWDDSKLKALEVQKGGYILG